ncbi:MAG: response regulator transcription factor [Gemmatimonadota bacterium]
MAATRRLCIYTTEPLEGTLLAHVLRAEFELDPIMAHTEDEVLESARECSMLIIREIDGNSNTMLPLLRAILKVNPRIEIIVLESANPLGALAYLQAGSAVYLRRESTIDNLFANVRASKEGRALLSPELAGKMLRRVQELARLAEDEQIDITRIEHLTAREQEIAQRLAHHQSNHEIASALGLATGTIKTHVHNILKKLDVDSRVLAGAYWRIHETMPERRRETG